MEIKDLIVGEKYYCAIELRDGQGTTVLYSTDQTLVYKGPAKGLPIKNSQTFHVYGNDGIWLKTVCLTPDQIDLIKPADPIKK